MGRTNPTFRDRLRRFEAEWQPYRRALRRSDQAHFDDLLELADRFAAASSNQNPTYAYRAILLSIALGRAIEHRELAERVDALEGELAVGRELTDRVATLENALRDAR